MKPGPIKTAGFLAALALISFIGAPALEQAGANAAATQSIEQLHQLDNATDQFPGPSAELKVG